MEDCPFVSVQEVLAWAQRGPSWAECFFQGKAPLAFIQSSKGLVILLHNKGTVISMELRRAVPRRVYINPVANGPLLKSALQDSKGSHINSAPPITPAEDTLTSWAAAPRCYTVPKLWSL